MESRQKILCGLGSLAIIGTSFVAGVWFGKRSNTFVLTKLGKELDSIQSENRSSENRSPENQASENRSPENQE